MMVLPLKRGGMRTTRDVLEFVLTVLMVAFLGAMLSGCALLDVLESQPAAIASDRAAFESAEADFMAGDYTSARKIFDRLAAGASLPEIRRAARYGLACTDMVQAENARRFQKAVESFLQVLSGPDSPSSGGPGEEVNGNRTFPDADPALLARGLSRGMVLTAQERNTARKQVSVRQAKAKKWKKEKAKLQHLIDTLQHQITVLERIDQERQDKRRVQ